MYKLIILSAFLTISSALYGQSEPVKNTMLSRFSIEASVNHIHYPDDNTEAMTGFGFGVNYEAYSGQSFKLITSVLFNRTELLKYNLLSHYSGKFDMTYQLDALVFAITARKEVIKGLALDAGIAFTEELKYSYEGYFFNAFGNTVGVSKIEGEDGFAKGIDPSVRLGINYTPTFLNEIIYTAITYNHGLHALTGQDNFEDDLDERVFNRYFQFSIGFNF